MGWDVNGMWTPDVERQPLGALGSVMQFMNSRRAHEISGQGDQLREAQIQQHQAQLEQEQFQLQEARKNAARDEELRAKMATLPEGASSDQAVQQYIRSGGDPSKILPFWRTQESLAGRKDIQTMKGDQAIGLEEKKQSSPLVGAKVENLESSTGLNKERTTDIAETRQPRIDLMKARGDTARMVAAAKLRKDKGGALTPKEKAGIIAKIGTYRKMIESSESKRDPMTLKMGPVDKQNALDMKADLGRLESLLAEPEPTDVAPTAPKSPTKSSSDNPLGLSLP